MENSFSTQEIKSQQPTNNNNNNNDDDNDNNRQKQNKTNIDRRCWKWK